MRGTNDDNPDDNKKKEDSASHKRLIDLIPASFIDLADMSHMSGLWTRITIIFAFAVVELSFVGLIFASPVSDPALVKAGFLFNFAKFVEWPTARLGPITFCVIGDDTIAAYLESSVAGKNIGLRSVVVRNRPKSAELNTCSVIYFGRSEKNKAGTIATSLAGAQILTVSEFPELGPKGVAINFFLDQERLRFELHPDAVALAGLKVSSSLLVVARIPGDKR